jgi:hypothetical protein
VTTSNARCATIACIAFGRMDAVPEHVAVRVAALERWLARRDAGVLDVGHAERRRVGDDLVQQRMGVEPLRLGTDRQRVGNDERNAAGDATD